MKELIADAMIAIATKDFSKLLPKIKEALPELIQIVIGCIREDKKVAEEEPALEGWLDDQYCTRLCSSTNSDKNSFGYKLCYSLMFTSIYFFQKRYYRYR